MHLEITEEKILDPRIRVMVLTDGPKTQPGKKKTVMLGPIEIGNLLYQSHNLGEEANYAPEENTSK